MIPISQIDPNLSIYKENTVVIWGAGPFGKELLKLLRNFQVEVTCFCDSNVKLWKTEVDGIPVILPQELQKMQLEQKGAIVVQLGLRPHNEAEVMEMVKAMGIETIITRPEAYQMLLIYAKVKSFQENSGLLKLNSEMPDYLQENLRKNVFERMVSHQDDWGISILMVGKTADLTIEATLREHGVSHVQTHFPWMYHRDFLGNRKLKIITAIREPISRDISHLYSLFLHGGLHIFTDTFYLDGDNDAQKYFNYMQTEEYKTDMCKKQKLVGREKDFSAYIQLWFTAFGENVVDVLQYPFDKEKGYTIIEEEHCDIFFYQLEKLNDIVPELSRWVGVPFEDLNNTNITEGQWMGASYKKATKGLKFSQEYFDHCYNDPYVQHCYSQEDIAKFKERWRGQIDPNK